jgi:hypothetical protein
MNLAAPAPRVDPAHALEWVEQETARADMVPESGAATALAAPVVEPAVVYDNPMQFAPESVRNPPPQPPSVAEALRTNADLATRVAVVRPAQQRFYHCPCLHGDREFVAYGDLEKYIAIKDGTCFVFGQPDGTAAPMYGVPLESFRAVLEHADHPDRNSVTVSPVLNTNQPRDGLVTVLLHSRDTGKLAFQFTFDTALACDKSAPKRFMELVEQQQKGGTSCYDSTMLVTASVVVDDRNGKETMKR